MNPIPTVLARVEPEARQRSVRRSDRLVGYVAATLVIVGGGLTTFAGVLFYIDARSPAALYNMWPGFYAAGPIAGLVGFGSGVLIAKDPSHRPACGWVALGCGVTSEFLAYGGLAIGLAVTLAGGVLAVASGPRATDRSVGDQRALSPRHPINRSRAQVVRSVVPTVIACGVVATAITAGWSYIAADWESTWFLLQHPVAYDLQAIYVDGDWTRNQSYEVVATPQPAGCDYGVAYLVNGYTSRSYWYQVGLGYDWEGGSSGFQFLYEVFGPAGVSVYPNAGTGAGSTLFSKSVNQGDSVVLNLTFSGGSVVMSGLDRQTGGRASASYSSEGAVSFQAGGEASSAGGTFTGLMTECYRGMPFDFNLSNTTYRDLGQPQTKGLVELDEWDYSWGRYPLFGTTVFPTQSSGALNYTEPPLHEFDWESVVTWSNATDFGVGTYD